MAITYTWSVFGLKITNTGNLQGYVVNAQWKKIGTDDSGNTGTFNGATPFTPDPSQPDFVPFDQLTEEIVLSWIQPVVTGSYEEHVNGVIAKEIAGKIDPITEVTPPWEPPTPDPTPPAPVEPA